MPFILPTDYTKLSVKQRRIVREQYVQKQDGLCAFCCGSLSKPFNLQEVYINKDLFPIGFFKNPIHLHHNHKTGMTIGALHAECNAIAWQYFGE